MSKEKIQELITTSDDDSGISGKLDSTLTPRLPNLL